MKTKKTYTQRFYEAINSDYRSKNIHVSNLTGECMRKSYYNMVYPQSFGMRLAMIFWWGKMAHKQQVFDHHEVPLEYAGVVGTCDEYEDGVLVDKKTTESLKYVKKPSDHYVRQIEYYALMLREGGWKKPCDSQDPKHVCTPGPVPVNEANIFYMSKAKDEKGKTAEIKIPLRPHETIKKEFLDKAKQLTDAVKTGKVPPRIKNAPRSWECEYCDYFKKCFGSKE